ncbi:MAG: capsular polysaccharide biosynthesis protein Cap8F [Anaerocolumna sp.]|nr:capsular polysaccharide biosynthesis protein Cap8F [Anaerocolumna sp.]
MKILVTGSNGFIGSNLITRLKSMGQDYIIYAYDMNTSLEELREYTKDCDFVFHFTGVHRTNRIEDFMEVNYLFFKELLTMLQEHGNTCPILYTSSIQATQDTEYAKSKRLAEEELKQHSEKTGAKSIIYRLTNTFGKWAKPGSHSVVANFCHNIARNEDIEIHSPDTVMNFYYIDDVIDSFVNQLKEEYTLVTDSINSLDSTLLYSITLKKLADKIYSFRESRNNNKLPDMKDAFTKKLYSTYLSYLQPTDFKYPLLSNKDNRGSFTEVFKTDERGQISVNVIKPGVKKGEHFHDTKCEKFLVISGEAKIQFRKIGTNEVINYYVSSKKMEVVDIPPGYTHNIINEGISDCVTLIWANEVFDPSKPDTYFCPV